MPGPDEKLNSTVISQPAIYVASLAAVEKLRQTEGEVQFGMLLRKVLDKGAPSMRELTNALLMVPLLQEAIQSADVAAGLSLGEYTALTFAGALRQVIL